MTKVIGSNALIDVNFILEKAQISDKMKMADLGCGSSGHFVFPASDLVGKHGKVYAVDILKTALESINKRARQENLTNIETVWSDIERFGATKIEANSVDVGLLVNTLYQSNKRAEIIRESIRMIKKGGKLVIVEWKNISSPFGPPAEERVKKELLESASKKLGLDTEQEFTAGPYHYGIIFTKL
ncbi:MAG: methyltransferase domain-containing protein [Candidatus Falkowbacteria bacterium]